MKELTRIEKGSLISYYGLYLTNEKVLMLMMN